MMTRSPSVLRGTLTLLSLRLVLEQIGLALLTFLLYAVWLKVPDASAFEVAGSVLLALIAIAIAGSGESSLFLRLVGHERTRVRLLRGSLLLLGGFVVWFMWSALLDQLRGDDALRAGYLNSRLPASVRYFFSYEHILLMIGWMWTAVEWIGAGVIAIVVFAGTASVQPLRAMLYASRSISYWIVLIVGSATATGITGALLGWTPGHGLRVEMISLVVRLAVATLVDAVLVCLVLAVLAECVRRVDAIYSTTAGTPDESQPRTVDNP
jgi:hypothetical protein